MLCWLLASVLVCLAAGRGLSDGYARHLGGQYPKQPLPKNIIPVPLYLQQTDYSCGPSSALALLRYWDWETYKHVTEQELYGPMNCTSANGTDPGPIAAYFVNYAHMEARYVSGIEEVRLEDLEASIDNGHPPIVDFQAWRDNNTVVWKTDWNDGHDHDWLFFMDPSTEGNYAYIGKKDFLVRWHDIVGEYNTHTYRMVVFVDGTSKHPHKGTAPDYATYED